MVFTSGYMEVMKPVVPASAGGNVRRIFYVIQAEDVGKRRIKIESGDRGDVIELISVIGYVQARDIGHRLYRVPPDDPFLRSDERYWIWQYESDDQYNVRAERMQSEATSRPVLRPRVRHDPGDAWGLTGRMAE